MSLPLLQEQGGPLSGLLSGISQGLQQSMPSIQEMIVNKQKQKQQQKLLQSILGTPQAAQPNVGQMLGLESQPSSQMAGLEITPEKIMALEAAGEHNMANSLSRIYQGQEKDRMKSKKVAEETKIGQESFDQMATLLKKGNLGLGSGIKGKVLGGKTAEDVGEFNSLTGALEAMLVDRVSRGTLSNSRFRYITETLLPKATDRQATIKGKLKGLARELGLNPAALAGKSTNSPQFKVSSGHHLMISPDGEVGEVETKNVKQAIAKGYKLHGR